MSIENIAIVAIATLVALIIGLLIGRRPAAQPMPVPATQPEPQPTTLTIVPTKGHKATTLTDLAKTQAQPATQPDTLISGATKVGAYEVLVKGEDLYLYLPVKDQNGITIPVTILTRINGVILDYTK